MIDFQGRATAEHKEKLTKLVKMMHDHLVSEVAKEEWSDIEPTEVAAWLCAMLFNVQPNTPLKQKQIKYTVKMLQEVGKG